MKLSALLKRQGYGAKSKLIVKAGITGPALYRALDGRASLATATRIHLATGRKVPIASMTKDAVAVAPSARKRKAASK